MDALIPAFVAALLCEFGDRTQLLAILLSKRYGKPAAVLLGIALAAAANMALASAAGLALAQAVPHSAVTLMTALALIFAGAGAFFRQKAAPPVDSWKLGALVSSFGSFFILAFGDKTQFIACTLAAGSGQPVLAAAGATAGVAIGNLPAVLLGDDWMKVAPVRAIRIAIGAILLLAGLVLAASALGIA